MDEELAIIGCIPVGVPGFNPGTGSKKIICDGEGCFIQVWIGPIGAEMRSTGIKALCPACGVKELKNNSDGEPVVLRTKVLNPNHDSSYDPTREDEF